MALYNIAERLSTAKELISRGDDASFIYAALELRFCLESVAYQNLAAYGEDVSTELAREWRPDQIIKMLATFDPNSDQTASFSISVTPLPEDLDFASTDLKAAFKDKDFLPIGEAKRIPWGKFRSYYNSLGSFLHLRKDLTNARPKIERLRVLIGELEEVASSTLIAAGKDLATGKCVDCGHVLILGPAEQAGTSPFSARIPSATRAIWPSRGPGATGAEGRSPGAALRMRGHRSYLARGSSSLRFARNVG